MVPRERVALKDGAVAPLDHVLGAHAIGGCPQQEEKSDFIGVEAVFDHLPEEHLRGLVVAIPRVETNQTVVCELVRRSACLDHPVQIIHHFGSVPEMLECMNEGVVAREVRRQLELRHCVEPILRAVYVPVPCARKDHGTERDDVGLVSLLAHLDQPVLRLLRVAVLAADTDEAVEGPLVGRDVLRQHLGDPALSLGQVP
mmetsp:Transcript_121437/g.344073  ORF Transcript_121437/g.344073 Transcript_121437/m.344073 type:complete len:200 (-) Transcript_121437:762-1361(-)